MEKWNVSSEQQESDSVSQSAYDCRDRTASGHCFDASVTRWKVVVLVPSSIRQFGCNYWNAPRPWDLTGQLTGGEQAGLTQAAAAGRRAWVKAAVGG